MATIRGLARRVRRVLRSATMPDLLVERHGAVMVATMNRPERKNAMTLQMFGRNTLN